MMMMINGPYLGLLVCWCCVAMCAVPSARGQVSGADGAGPGQVNETTDYAHRVHPEGAARGVLPRPYTGDEFGLITLWRPESDGIGQGDGTNASSSPPEYVDSPWGTRLSKSGESLEARTVTVPGFEQGEFTAELWFCFPGKPAPGKRRRGLLEYFVGDERAWGLFLDDDFRLTFRWQDQDGNSASRTAPYAPIDHIYAGHWVHVAVTFRNLRSIFTSDADFTRHGLDRYSAMLIYITPAGTLTPNLAGGMPLQTEYRTEVQRTMPQMRMEAGTLVVGGSDDALQFDGVVAEAALFAIMKQENQFGTLGGSPPADLVIRDDIPGGSGRDPVVNEAGQIVLSGGGKYKPSDSFWYHLQVDGRPGWRRFVLLSLKGNSRMAGSAFVSYDRERWERIPDTLFVVPGIPADRAGQYLGQLHVTVNLKQTPAWIATAIPYLEENVAKLEAEMADWQPFQARDIGRSAGDRPIRGWIITDPATGADGKQTIVMHHGQHSPIEDMDGLILDSMVRALRAREDADELLERFAFLIVPLMNPDGAAEGQNTQLSRNAVNLNRDWEELSQPESASVVAFLDDWVQAGGVIAAGMDWHAAGFTRPSWLIAGRTADLDALAPGLGAKQQQFEQALEKHMGFWFTGHSAIGKAGGPNFSRMFPARYRAPCFTVEIAAQKHFHPRTQRVEPLTQELLEELGPALLEACLAFLAGR